MLRETLRTRTAALHQSIERSLALTEIAGEQQYLALLSGLYGFYVPIEARLERLAEAFRDAGFALAPRLKSGWLAEDLRALGLDSSALSALPQCAALPALSDAASAVGCLYVLEGSTLGGQVLARHFQRALSLSPAKGCRFFHAYGENTAKMWRSFVEFLDAQEACIPRLDVAVNTAQETFQCLERWLILRRASG